MKKIWPFRMLILISIMISLLLSAAAPMPAQFVTAGVQAGQDFVRLTIRNKSTNNISLRLDGPSVYLLPVKAEKTGVFTIQKGSYDYIIYACGFYAKGTLDMSHQKTLVIPICGGNAASSGNEPSKVDLSATVKVVKVTLSNESTTRLLAIFTGPGTYVFTLNKNEEKDYTIAKGTYDVKYYACGEVTTRKFYAYKGSSLEFECP